jgi:uncharacterized protein (DUF1800 family)
MPDPRHFRFGLGPRPGGGLPPDPAAQLDGPDAMAERHPGPPRAQVFAAFATLREARRADPPDPAALMAAEAAMTALVLGAQRRHIARALDSETPWRERLVRFWANHFSVTPKARILIPEWAEMIESAIRPQVGGRFSDLLRASVLHPAMLRYLDQDSSIGPNSRMGRNRGLGLNENLGRELLELHTLGADGPYAQTDVRAVALLLTGHTVDRGASVFEVRRAEPGVQTILGRRYGGLIRREGDLPALLDDLAARPETAAHLSRKLAAHVVADEPPAALVADLAAEWRASSGELGRVSAALAAHPLALDAPPAKIRPPFDWLVAALRALGVTGAEVMGWPDDTLRRLVLTPMTTMGQNWMGAPSPAGWPDTAPDWLTAPALAARIDWAMDAPARLRPALPDARAFVDVALAGGADDRLRRLVAASETNTEALGLVLSAPAFMRR